MKKRETIYVTGHRNPDSDSICAAIAYAELKNRRGKDRAIPIRLGPINRETRFILDYFGLEAPILKETMKPMVEDLDIDPPYPISQTTSMNKALNTIQNENISNLQVVDGEGKLLGIVTLTNLTEGYMDIWDDNILGRSKTPLENIVEVMRGEIVHQPEKPREISGRMTVYAMDPDNVEDNIGENDIVILGNREDAQLDAIKRGVSMMILTIGTEMKKEILDLAIANDVTIISTELDTFLAARLLPLSVPVGYVMTMKDLVKFRDDDFVDEISLVMGKTRYRSYPIVDHKDNVLGSISRYHLISQQKKPLILVDHNERNQSIPDIEFAEISEIIDHHRVANVNTSSPIFFRNEPVGSTSTIVSKMFFEQGVSPSREIAGILCSAIISDTLLLKSPTATDEDKRMMERMAKIASIDIESYADQMFKAGTSLEDKSVEDLLSEDMKKFEVEGEKIRIAQVMTMDLDNLSSIKDQLVKKMEETMMTNGESTFMLVFTDILKETSEILVVGEFDSIIAREFGEVLKDHSFPAPGVLSRKKQVVPRMTNAIINSKL